MPVFTLNQIKPLLGIDLGDVSQDVVLTYLLQAVEDQLQRLTRLRLAPVTITEWYEGTWDKNLFLRECPVRSITSVHRLRGEEGAWGEGDLTDLEELVEGKDYYLKLDWTLLTNPVVHVSRTGMVVNRDGWFGALERRAGRVIPRETGGTGNYRLIYEAGFPTGQVPSEFLIAVAAGIQYALMTVPTGGLLTTSESLDGRSLGLSNVMSDDEFSRIGAVSAMLARYRRAYVG